MDFKKASKSHLTHACLVGSNGTSAFLSWRLQATTSCDVTLVWKSGFEAVAQYGVSFKYAVSQPGFASKTTHLTGIVI